MRRFLQICVLVLAARSSALAAPRDDLATAIRGLAASPNYSWMDTVTVNQQDSQVRPPLKVRGQTERNGYTVMAWGVDKTGFLAYFKGSKALIHTPEGWKLSTAPQRLKTPDVLSMDWISQFHNVQATNDGFTAEFSADDAKAQLQQKQAKAVDATVSFRFWVADGALAKYEIHIQGDIELDGKSAHVDRTTSTEIKDIGNTTVAVPDEVRAKLESN